MPKARSQEFVASEDDRSSSPVQKKPREARKVGFSLTSPPAALRSPRTRFFATSSGGRGSLLAQLRIPVRAECVAQGADGRTHRRDRPHLAPLRTPTCPMQKQAKREQTPSSDSESSEEKPLKKKSKKAEPAASSNKKQESVKGRSESPETKRKVGATAKYGSGVETKTNAEGDKYVELAKNRRATVRSFKDKVYVDIRETYEKDGEAKPGKKGIMLNVEQWDRLKKAIAAVSLGANAFPSRTCSSCAVPFRSSTRRSTSSPESPRSRSCMSEPPLVVAVSQYRLRDPPCLLPAGTPLRLACCSLSLRISLCHLPSFPSALRAIPPSKRIHTMCIDYPAPRSPRLVRAYWCSEQRPSLQRQRTPRSSSSTPAAVATPPSTDAPMSSSNVVFGRFDPGLAFPEVRRGSFGWFVFRETCSLTG